ncbi:D-alanyl-D-alanine carboxypeptidase family protein [Agromyces arachidis]|uniref:D-alanyl-D-alanine carboxypeptidase family protein n=1 Tax=Agromyces arachidis TaxID=766966 RepID=UPI004055C866
MVEGTQPSPEVQRRRLLVASVLSIVLIVGSFVVLFATGAGSGGPDANAETTPAPSAEATAQPGTARPSPAETPAPEPVVPAFDKGARSIDDPASIWVVVDKLRPLQPADYEPADLVSVPVAHTWEPLLRAEASDAVVAMFEAASQEAGLALASNSAYRSYSTQQEIYSGDDDLTARPGHSEHQTGLAIDIGAESGACSLDVCFADTPEGQWLRDNAHRFGFVLRYPADKQPVTGYQFEPWHFRYVGVDLATEMRSQGITTLEEFFGLPPAPVYP